MYSLGTSYTHGKKALFPRLAQTYSLQSLDGLILSRIDRLISLENRVSSIRGLRSHLSFGVVKLRC
jgi:hypothetical protein